MEGSFLRLQPTMTEQAGPPSLPVDFTPLQAFLTPKGTKPMFSRRTLAVGVAVVFEPDRGFFLSYNRHWHGYAFPMRKFRMTDVDLTQSALEALRDETDLPLRGATIHPLVSLEIEGESQRTRQPTLYRYHAFQADPPVALSDEVAPLGFACQRVFLKPHDIALPTPVSPSAQTAAGAGKAAGMVPTPGADPGTWSTRRIVEALIGNQRVAVAVICRPGVAGPEFLMNRNANYGGYFPIASRCRTDGSPGFEVREAIRADTGYRPWVSVGEPAVVEDRHFSHRFQCERHFAYSLFPVTFRGVDLSSAGNELDDCQERSGLLWRWVAADELENPGANDLSPTISTIRDALRQMATKSEGGSR
jgi:hypothetical protein